MPRTLFPTSLYYEPLAAKARLTKLNNEILREAYILRQIDEEGRRWSRANYVGGYTSYASLTDVHKTSPTFGELKKRIDAHVARFARHLEMDLEGGRLEMSTCWVNIMPTGTHHSGHIHPLSVISGTYYAATPKGCGVLKFEDPRLPLMMNAPPKRGGVSRRNALIHAVSPREGQLVLFESWLRHEVTANTAKEDRVSVSFNYEWV